jgi:hypothetical protein
MAKYYAHPPGPPLPAAAAAFNNNRDPFAPRTYDDFRRDAFHVQIACAPDDSGAWHICSTVYDEAGITAFITDHERLFPEYTFFVRRDMFAHVYARLRTPS